MSIYENPNTNLTDIICVYADLMITGTAVGDRYLDL